MNINIIGLSAGIMLLLDFAFLSLISGYFSKMLYQIQKSPLKVNFGVAGITYLLMVFALNYFILQKSGIKSRMQSKLPIIDAFLLGFVIYGIYETTNLATITNWSYKLALIDTFWGGTLFALTTYFTCKILHLI